VISESAPSRVTLLSDGVPKVKSVIAAVVVSLIGSTVDLLDLVYQLSIISGGKHVFKNCFGATFHSSQMLVSLKIACLTLGFYPL